MAGVSSGTCSSASSSAAGVSVTTAASGGVVEGSADGETDAVGVDVGMGESEGDGCSNSALSSSGAESSGASVRSAMELEAVGNGVASEEVNKSKIPRNIGPCKVGTAEPLCESDSNTSTGSAAKSERDGILGRGGLRDGKSRREWDGRKWRQEQGGATAAVIATEC
ncbi:hypothetical protein FGB62_2g54 [Gracilaria domingensis]|nr:hypothetical protein FGB62_2g54 [Gracilaria domingensis]